MSKLLGIELLEPGESGVVTDITADGEFLRRLEAFGLICGAKIKLIRRAPLGDPLELFCRGVRVVIRVSDASHIRVRAIPRIG
ncbi:MAG: FeoA family protein [Eubacteriales bacterium]